MSRAPATVVAVVKPTLYRALSGKRSANKSGQDFRRVLEEFDATLQDIEGAVTDEDGAKYLDISARAPDVGAMVNRLLNIDGVSSVFVKPNTELP